MNKDRTAAMERTLNALEAMSDEQREEFYTKLVENGLSPADVENIQRLISLRKLFADQRFYEAVQQAVCEDLQGTADTKQPPKEFTEALAALAQAEPSVKPAIGILEYVCMDDQTVVIKTADNMEMFRTMINSKRMELDKYLSQAFGRRVRSIFLSAKDSGPRITAESREAAESALSKFDNVEYVE